VESRRKGKFVQGQEKGERIAGFVIRHRFCLMPKTNVAVQVQEYRRPVRHW